jgi:hypothetical protein
MRAAAVIAAESGKAHEWRIGLNAWHAFCADLTHREIWDREAMAAPPTTFLAFPVVRVLDAKEPTGWELKRVPGKFHLPAKAKA